MAMVGLAGHEASRSSELSWDKKQRLAIARAMDAQPREVLLKICEAERNTIVFVPHIISKSIFPSDQVVVMATLPGAIRAVSDVDLPHPRDRSSVEFVEMEKKIKQMVREEAQKLGVSSARRERALFLPIRIIPG